MVCAAFAHCFGVTFCVVFLVVFTSFTLFWAAKLVQTERKSKFICIFLRCSLISSCEADKSWCKIRTKKQIYLYFSEVQPNFKLRSR